MDTVYDWVSIALFAGLIVLFLQRSTSDRAENDVPLLYYLGAGAGCAVANWVGNKHHDIIAVLVLAATVGFIFYFLKPFQKPSSS